MHQLLQEAHDHLRLEEYDKARAPLLQAIGCRDDINEPETISYILTSVVSQRYVNKINWLSETG
jgi:hypothetical protein